MNDALTLPFFTQGPSSYSPTPPFPDNYDGQFANGQDDFYSGSYDLDTSDGDASGLVLNGGMSNSDSDGRRSNGACLKSCSNRFGSKLIYRPQRLLLPHSPDDITPHRIFILFQPASVQRTTIILYEQHAELLHQPIFPQCQHVRSIRFPQHGSSRSIDIFSPVDS